MMIDEEGDRKYGTRKGGIRSLTVMLQYHLWSLDGVGEVVREGEEREGI